jgi:hypothetical protein
MTNPAIGFNPVAQAAFEEWAREDIRQYPLGRDIDGHYRRPATQKMYRIWLAAWNAGRADMRRVVVAKYFGGILDSSPTRISSETKNRKASDGDIC